jgi:hypothetical protein
LAQAARQLPLDQTTAILAATLFSALLPQQAVVVERAENKPKLQGQDHLAVLAAAHQEEVLAVLETHLAPPHRKDQTEAQEVAPARTLAVVAVVAHRLLGQTEAGQKAAMAALGQRQALAVRQSLMAEAVVAVDILRRPQQMRVQAALAVAQMVAQKPMVQTEVPTRAAAVVAQEAAAPLAFLTQAAQAALASSSSNTTSALPQSSPSSHRRSGLHQRVR